MKKSNTEIIYYSQSEIVQFIKEDKLTIWDLAEKLRITQFRRTLLYEFLRQNIKPKNLVEELIAILEENTQNYLDNRTNKNDKLTYNTLHYMANNGKTQFDIMKHFAISSYPYYTQVVKKVLKSGSTKSANKIREKIRSNLKDYKVIILNETKDTEITVETDELEMSITSQTAITGKGTSSFLPVTATLMGNQKEKLIIYTNEYLENCKELKKELYEFHEEKVILSSTLSLLMKGKQISTEKRILITNALNDPLCNFKVLPNSSFYKFEKIPHSHILASENDLIISQALLLSRYTTKNIFIATTNSYTAFNVLSMSFGVRVPKNRLNTNWFEEDPLPFLDYQISSLNFADNYDSNIVSILDTCVFLYADKRDNDKREIIKQILLSRKNLKLIPKVVLEEFKDASHLSFLLCCLKHNPTLQIEFESSFQYRYNDLRILNFAMYYQNTHPEKEITIITYDFAFYMEVLQYNIKAQYIEYIPKQNEKNLIES